MSDDVVVMVADDNYIEHAKSLLVNFHRQGEWRGDYCIITQAGSNVAKLAKRGIHICEIPDQQWDFMNKFWAFTPYFHKWKRALCVDIDIFVQGNVQKIFDGLGPRLPNILCNLEDGPILGALKYWDPKAAEHGAIYAEIEQAFPHVNQRMFNMAFIFYAPQSMPLDTMARLRGLHEQYKDVNPTCADQMLVNLMLYDRLEEAGKDYFCFFGFDYPGNRIYSEFRKWRGDEFPSILHYTRWHAPWLIKRTCDTPAPNTEPGGYRNHRLNRICHELYGENLGLFDEVFPLK